MKFLESIKDELRPDKKISKLVDEFIEKLNFNLKKNKIKATCVKGGSTAKGTFLKNDHDIDLFVVFDKAYKGKNISEELFSAIKEMSPVRIHGSRDYFHINKEGFTFEIVPVMEVKDANNIENVTDMSPKHVAWVNKKLNDKLRDDIRLTKKFMKAQKVYGAESYINGFSGHVVDILIIYYGGFLNLLKAARNWKEKTIIDVEKKMKDPLKDMDKSKTFGPLIIVDPVQPERNASAAVSKEKFEKFIEASKLFLKTPSKDFFIEKEFDIDKIKKSVKKENLLVIINAESTKGSKDVSGTKLLKCFENIEKQLTLNEFTILKSDWKWDKAKNACFYFVIKEKKLSATFERMGPPKDKKNALIEFKKKNKDTFEKNGRIYANVKRKFDSPEKFVKDLIKKDFIKDKVKKIEIVK